MPLPRPLTVIALVCATALALVGCSSSPTTAGSSSTASVSTQSFPVSITHAYGTTTITAKPQRVATVAWANHEVPLALGVVPVGMSKATWGDDDGDGVLPWVEKKLNDLGAATPVLFDETDGIDFEAVAETEPDVILAAYSGLTREDYDTLSKIAPTVAYPTIAWGTSVQDMITLNSTAMGMAAEGQKLIASLDSTIKATFAANPTLAGKKVLFSYIDPKDLSKIGFYTAHDTRPGFLASAGMANPSLVIERSAATKAFYETVSAEQADKFNDVDILVTYGPADGSLLTAMQADPLLSKIPAVKRGSVVTLVDSTPLAASANPSPLSIDWGLKEYVALFAAAAAKVS
jgi:iron complex transport system substrate-binding protein